jgi:hypothetical protein
MDTKAQDSLVILKIYEIRSEASWAQAVAASEGRA